MNRELATPLRQQLFLLITFASLVVLLACAAVNAAGGFVWSGDSPSYVSGSFSTGEQADYSSTLQQRVAAQRPIARD